MPSTSHSGDQEVILGEDAERDVTVGGCEDAVARDAACLAVDAFGDRLHGPGPRREHVAHRAVDRSPSPVRCLRTIAAHTTYTAARPPARSAIGTAAVTGTPGSGVSRATPCLIVEVVARHVRGSPICPMPESEQYTTPGLTARTASYPTPSRSTTPGRKPSTTTSASAARSSARCTPSAVFRSSTMLRLLTFSHAKSPGYRAHRVAARRFDLAHVGAELAEELRRVRAGAPIERSRMRTPPSSPFITMRN